MSTNIRDYARKFSRTSIVSGHNVSGPHIMLPFEQFDHSITMCDRNRESIGYLIYSRQGSHFLVECLLEMNFGSRTTVSHHPLTLEASRYLLAEHANLGYIEFHTHPRPQWGLRDDINARFSDPDFRSIATNINSKNDYMHVLFTKSHILTCGLCMPSVVLINKRFPELEERNATLKKRFNEIVTWLK